MKKTKSKVLVVSTLLVCSMFVLSMNALAGSMNVTATTDKSSYTLGETVKIHASWTITDPSPYTADYCLVDMDITYKPTTYAIHVSGDYTVQTSQKTGVVDVYCSGNTGTADYDWVSSAGWTGTWFVDVLVHVEGTEDVDGQDATPDFELT